MLSDVFVVSDVVLATCVLEVVDEDGIMHLDLDGKIASVSSLTRRFHTPVVRAWNDDQARP